jgi:hypothetical protein
MSDQNRNQVEEYTLPHTLKLEVPVPWGKDEEVTEIVFERRLTAEDIFSMPVQGQTLGDTFRLVGKMTNKPLNFIKRMDAKDIVEASKVVNYFLPSGQEND